MMITIKKSDIGNYIVNYQKPIELFKKRHGTILMNEIERIIKDGNKVNVNLDPVVDFSRGGYQLLNKMIQNAKQVKCRMNFTYFGVDISNRIELLSDYFNHD